MIKFVHGLRNRKMLMKWFPVLVLLWGILGIILLLGRALLSDNPGLYLLMTSFYYTAQSNIFITVILILFLLGFSEKKWFKDLSFIALVNIIMTGIIFHTLLKSNFANISFLRHVLHTINPILYFLFYFISVPGYVGFKKFWISLIYPILYFLYIHLFVEPLFGDLLDRLMVEYDDARYVYPFLDPGFYNNGYVGLFVFIFAILAPIICTLALSIDFLKFKLEKKIQTRTE